MTLQLYWLYVLTEYLKGVVMSVFKRGKRYGIGYSHQGKWQRKMVADTKKEALEIEREVKRKISREIHLGIAEPKKMYFEELCEEYLIYSERNKKPSTNRRDKTSIKNLSPVFDGHLITHISLRDVEYYKNMRWEKVEPATVNRELGCIRHMFNKAVEWEFLYDNHLRYIKLLKEPPAITRYLTKVEIQRLLVNCNGHIKPIVIMAVNTGMRKGEILNLKWQYVDLKNRIITITHSKNNEMRTVPINDMLYNSLIEHGPQHPNQYVFSHPDGRPYGDVKTGFKKALKRAGITEFRFHDLRSTYAVHLALNGTRLLHIKNLLGHKDISVTLRYCQFADKLMEREAVDKLNFLDYNASGHHTFTAHLGEKKCLVASKR